MKILYFTDAMCSWCYGFSPTIKKFKEQYPSIEVQIIAGGFSPYSKQIVDAEYKKFLEYHWKNVNLRSGQPFDHTMRFVSETFRYNTEPSSRALVVVQTLLPAKDLDFLSLMQTAFYVEGKDITQETVLSELAEKIGIEKSEFLKTFYSPETAQTTIEGFQVSRQLGVQGFPTILSFADGKYKPLTRGFQTFDALKPIIDNELRKIGEHKATNGPSCTDNFCEN